MLFNYPKVRGKQNLSHLISKPESFLVPCDCPCAMQKHQGQCCTWLALEGQKVSRGGEMAATCRGACQYQAARVGITSPSQGRKDACFPRRQKEMLWFCLGTGLISA